MLFTTKCLIFLIKNNKNQPLSPPYNAQNTLFLENRVIFTEEFKLNHYLRHMILMSEISGYCLKCKNYVPIKDGKLVKMKNGRVRMGGLCSQPGCTGKISKIVS